VDVSNRECIPLIVLKWKMLVDIITGRTGDTKSNPVSWEKYAYKTMRRGWR
jgi:hypothetical protein